MARANEEIADLGIVGWREVLDEQGNELPVTTEAKRILYGIVPDIVGFVGTFCLDQRNFVSIGDNEKKVET